MIRWQVAWDLGLAGRRFWLRNSGKLLFLNLVSESLEAGFLEFRIGKLGMTNWRGEREDSVICGQVEASGLRFASWIGSDCLQTGIEFWVLA